MKKFIRILCAFLFVVSIISIPAACNVKTDQSEPETKKYPAAKYSGTKISQDP